MPVPVPLPEEKLFLCWRVDNETAHAYYQGDLQIACKGPFRAAGFNTLEWRPPFLFVVSSKPPAVPDRKFGQRGRNAVYNFVANSMPPEWLHWYRNCDIRHRIPFYWWPTNEGDIEADQHGIPEEVSESCLRYIAVRNNETSRVLVYSSIEHLTASPKVKPNDVVFQLNLNDPQNVTIEKVGQVTADTKLILE